MIRSEFKKKRLKKCAVKSCRSEFEPRSISHRACGPACALQLAQDSRVRTERKETKQKLEKFKTRSEYMRDAQIVWNRYVRARDIGRPCASCGAMPDQKYGGTMDCSHYRSVGSAPHLRFHLHNAASACVKCNRYLGGNVAALRQGLIARIGLAKVEAVEADNVARKFTVEYLIRLKKIFTKKTKRMEKR